MGLFSKLFGKKENQAQPKKVIQLPATIEIIPSKLTAKIFAHKVNSQLEGELDCVTYITEGLLNLGQKELSLTIRKDQFETIPEDPTKFFRTIYKLAGQGHIVTNGGISQLGQGSLLGWKGILYTSPSKLLLPHFNIENYLSMVLLSEDELKATQSFGKTRILSLLGKQTRYFPFPHWVDTKRSILPINNIAQKSIISKIAGRVTINESTVTLEENCIVLRVTKPIKTPIPADIPTDIPIAIFSSLNDEADCCLVWDGSAPDAEAISPPNSKGEKVGGNFISIVPGQNNYSSRIIEDGFSILITDELSNKFWDAMKSNSNFKINSEGNEMNFELKWV